MKLIISFMLLMDTLIPSLLHDPTQTIYFHLSRASTLYKNAIIYAGSDPKGSVKLALRAQNHMTLLEENVRQITNTSAVPFTAIQQSFGIIEAEQQSLRHALPVSYSQSVDQLVLFEKRTQNSVHKLYYESLLKPHN